MPHNTKTSEEAVGWEIEFYHRFFNPAIPSPAELKTFIRQIESEAFCKGREAGLREALEVLPERVHMEKSPEESPENDPAYLDGFNSALTQSREAITKLIEP